MIAVILGATERTMSIGALEFTAWEMGEGPLVLCLHGFPDTPATWRHLLPELAAAGYRAVAVTSRGYEPSSQPANGDYSLAALSGDVIDWIEALGGPSAHLIGHDWGSSICHLAAARAPDRIASLTALAVPHPAGYGAVVASDFAQLERSWYVFFFQAEALSDLIVGPTTSPSWNTSGGDGRRAGRRIRSHSTPCVAPLRARALSARRLPIIAPHSTLATAALRRARPWAQYPSKRQSWLCPARRMAASPRMCSRLPCPRRCSPPAAPWSAGPMPATSSTWSTRTASRGGLTNGSAGSDPRLGKVSRAADRRRCWHCGADALARPLAFEFRRSGVVWARLAG